MVEKSASSFCSRAKRLARKSLLPSTMTMTLSKKLSRAGRIFEISVSAER